MAELINLQKKVEEFCKKNNLKTNPEYLVLDLVSETGETAKELLKSSEYGRKPSNKNKEMELEIGDAFYSLITIANHYNINLEEVLENVLQKYEKRMKKGSPGSENE